MVERLTLTQRCNDDGDESDQEEVTNGLKAYLVRPAPKSRGQSLQELRNRELSGPKTAANREQGLCHDPRQGWHSQRCIQDSTREDELTPNLPSSDAFGTKIIGN